MQGTLHHPWHWMHLEVQTAGRWCSRHIIHDYHFWLFLLIAASVAVLIALIMLSNNSGTLLDHELRYYAYPSF